ncbi:MAG TPA: hypothetical protein VGC21_22660 [Telluria sp.]|jgi:uncharacterized membrane protein YidH (DUF202 family)
MFTSGILLRFFIVYGVALLALALLNRREFKRHPEKRARYMALPLGYKMACWLIVVPLFAGTVVVEGAFVVAIVSFFVLESACVRWYKKSGLL